MTFGTAADDGGAMDRYTVISADCHAGADLRDYRPYLESRYHDDFDAWAEGYVHPFRDLREGRAVRNWDNEVRTAALDEDGISGEVVFPNTVPPFFPISGLITIVPSPVDFELRLAGLRAHNRWLAEWCATEPARRAGVAQLLLNDVDEAVADVHWIADHGLRGGALLPPIPPGAGIDQLHSPIYEPLWAACAARGVILNVHGGGGTPDLGMHPASLPLFVLEASFYSHRPLWALIMAGVFDRHPDLRLVLTEAGTSWVPQTLDAMDYIHAKMAKGNIGALPFANPLLLSRPPSSYFATNCWITSSFMSRADCLDRHFIGVDRIMWGSDFPHEEGTYPYSIEAIQNTFAGVPREEVEAMLTTTAAGLYDFDLAALASTAARIGPPVGDVSAGLDTLPDSESLAFEPRHGSVA
jgi:predicted TIM-barrel fold metal-dependent hydrolase